MQPSSGEGQTTHHVRQVVRCRDPRVVRRRQVRRPGGIGRGSVQDDVVTEDRGLVSDGIPKLHINGVGPVSAREEPWKLIQERYPVCTGEIGVVGQPHLYNRNRIFWGHSEGDRGRVGVRVTAVDQDRAGDHGAGARELKVNGFSSGSLLAMLTAAVRPEVSTGAKRTVKVEAVPGLTRIEGSF